MNKNLATWIIGCFALAASAQAGAQWNDTYVDRAKVISATPIYETIEINRPVEQCYDERVVRGQRGHHSPAGTIIGGIAGGVLGNQIGHGRGRTVATVVGTDAVGAIAHGPWRGRVYGGQSVACDREGKVVARCRDRDREVRVFRF